MSSLRVPHGLIGSRLLQVAWTTAIVVALFATLLPMAEQTPRFAYADKVFHFGYFLLLGVLAVLSQRQPLAALFAALGTVGLGVLIEIIQWFLPWRSFEWLDILADTVGVLVGYALTIRLQDHPAQR
ncbi:MAG: VanZ family protein [Pseudomonadota bacterium]|nr:VanZ family protein [Pseudomonadota bacterium]